MSVEAGSPRTFQRGGASTCESTATRNKLALAFDLAMRARAAGVFLECFLGQAVEGERGDGAF